MSLIHLSASQCVRPLAKESECRKCEAVCPTGAIVIESTLPSINFSACVGCGACHAICPSEALGLDDFSSTDFFFDFLEEGGNLISCEKNVPCIAGVSVEHLISLAALKKDIILDMGHCEGCEIAHKCKTQILHNYDEACYILEAMESDAKITLENVAFSTEKNESTRREFLRSINLKTFAKTRLDFEREVQKATDELIEHTLQKADIALLKQKKIPHKRRILFSAIKRVEKPSLFHTIDANEISFTSQKVMDEAKCTACQMCYRLCPSGALTSDVKNSKIDFDPLLCIKCHVCHDVCESDAITLSKAYSIKEFFEPSVQNLVSFNVRNCRECGMSFSTNSNDKLCYRCKIEEQEARDLWGIEEEY